MLEICHIQGVCMPYLSILYRPSLRSHLSESDSPPTYQQLLSRISTLVAAAPLISTGVPGRHYATHLRSACRGTGHPSSRRAHTLHQLGVSLRARRVTASASAPCSRPQRHAVTAGADRRVTRAASQPARAECAAAAAAAAAFVGQSIRRRCRRCRRDQYPALQWGGRAGTGGENDKNWRHRTGRRRVEFQL